MKMNNNPPIINKLKFNHKVPNNNLKPKTNPIHLTNLNLLGRYKLKKRSVPHKNKKLREIKKKMIINSLNKPFLIKEKLQGTKKGTLIGIESLALKDK